ncbi:hypothetical protein LP414_27670 [Polaromonas sp. P1(28)-13]|nr:hypothetical protein LP414_27670 [Polaromonas sp. P1(28)-13]
MHQFLIVNILIIVLIIAGIVWTSNPMFMFGLMFLVQMPFVAPGPDEDDDESQPMGFTAKVS